MIQVYRLPVTLLIASLLGGCAGISGQQDPKQCPVIESDSTATLHIYKRPQGTPSVGVVNLFAYVDGVEVGRINEGDSVVVKIRGGCREVSARAKSFGIPDLTTFRILVAATPGEDYFVRWSVRSNQGGLTRGFELVDKATWNSRR